MVTFTHRSCFFLLFLGLPSEAIPAEDSACDYVAKGIDDDTSFMQKPQKPHYLHTGSGLKVDLSRQNMVYIKVAKTGSSTAGGVNRRIAFHHNLSGVFTDRLWITDNGDGEPGAWSDHGRMRLPETESNITLERLEALEMPFFLWSVIREPSKRAMSGLYWGAALESLETTQGKIETLKMSPDFQFNYLKPGEYSSVESVFNFYNFIGVTDRYDESLVALSQVLQAPLTDMLYITAKNTSAGMGHRDGRDAIEQPPLEEEPEELQDYLRGDFKKENYLDYKLFDNANSNLDRLISANKLEGLIGDFSRILAHVQSECTPEGTETNYLGDLTECYSWDAGCAYECVDRQVELLKANGNLTCEWFWAC
jgi:hypothetical protein